MNENYDYPQKVQNLESSEKSSNFASDLNKGDGCPERVGVERTGTEPQSQTIQSVGVTTDLNRTPMGTVTNPDEASISNKRPLGLFADNHNENPYIYTLGKLCEMIGDCPHGLSYSDDTLTKAYDIFAGISGEGDVWNCEDLCGNEENCGKGDWKCWHKFFSIVKTLEK